MRRWFVYLFEAVRRRVKRRPGYREPRVAPPRGMWRVRRELLRKISLHYDKRRSKTQRNA